MQRVVIASDHGGFNLKEKIKELLIQKGFEVRDEGCFNSDSCDYPDYGFKAAKAVSNGEAFRGVLICTSGIGMSMVGNRVKGVRAALCCNEQAAFSSRTHNDANVLVLGSNFVDVELAKKIVNIFFDTSFDGGRHLRRVQKIEDFTDNI